MLMLLPRRRRLAHNSPVTGDNAVNSAASVGVRLGHLALVFVAMLILFPWPGDASAQRKRIVFDEDEEGSKVEGYVHRPEVGYIISRQEQEDLETLQLKESFLPKVIKSVEKKPF
jgi:hypothetical protein